ncbi:efflux RND transporter permease subunit [Robertkochia marina]|uniref:Efflux RND transporter permease subunit n=1 Tax=Robertkochia marina TaxID=1227945 RepID=A0A4S3M3K5_9FLAO|nr:efflux RND transporter permease subunit [Robertkochia marina]THD69279.1 efflux RND transporter permease subunit [Robertkochia marina]TRZ47462.1 efflux RND transporter permease subunit [Robertkochia marina]
MNLTQFSIERNRITFTVLGTIMLLGISLYVSLSRDSMPPYTVRVANIITKFPGAGPERTELLVTDRVEKIAQELPELKEMSSTSRTGLSVVTVTLKDEVSPDILQSVWDRLRRKLSSMEGLPEGVTPFLDDDGLGDVYGIVVGLTGEGFSYAELKEFADDIKDDMIKLPDAAKVELGGVQDERVFVEYEDAKLKEYGLSSSRLQNLITSTNILSSGGQINLDQERIILEPTGNFNSVDEIRDMLVPVGEQGTQMVALKDLARVEKGYIDPPSQVVSIEGERGISIHINLIEGANVVNLGEDVDKVVAEWEAKLPVGLKLTRMASMDTYIDDKINDFVVNLIQAVVIVLLVMLFFLGVRSGLVIASLIPMVIVMTLMIMGIMDIGLNQVTLAALIMALGMMVDNAIVVAETIMVKMDQGVPPKSAAIEACSELSIPLLISTLTTSAAFLAFYLAESTMGDIVGPIFVVISIALLSSWILALTVITLFCFLFLKPTKKEERKPSLIDKVLYKLKLRYKDLILVALSRKLLVVVGILGLFLLSLLGFSKIPFLFFPDSDRNLITVDINLPEGTRIEATQALIADLETYMRDSLQVNETREEGVLDWSAYIGAGPASYDLGYTPDEPNSNYAHILVNTSDATLNNFLIEKLDSYCFNTFPGADIKVAPLGSGGGGTSIEIKVSGEDPDALSDIALDIRKKLSAQPGTKNVKDDWGPKSKKFLINIDQNRAQMAGVTSQDIAISLQTILDGFKTGEYREDDKSIPILMRGDTDQQQSLESLETLNVYAQSTGKSVPLLQVASIIPLWQYAKVQRFDQERTINVSSELTADGNAAAIMQVMLPWLDEQQRSWPQDFYYQLGGDAKNSSENMGAVLRYLPLSGFIIVLLLIIQFNSFRKMIMIVLTIPLGIIGVVIGLLLFNQSFGFMPFLGVISLAGIVINNAIVLIDRMEMEQRELGRDPHDAIISACLQRFRPILLATFTTVLGLIPLYLSGGDMWEGMAVSIMVGLLFGTVITLLFIPSMYSLMYKVHYHDYEFDEALLEE